MPLDRYGVLVGPVIGRKPETGTDTPHYQVHVRANGVDYRVAVNVRSAQSPPDLLYLAVEDFAHPVVTALNDLGDGFTAVPSGAGARRSTTSEETCSIARRCGRCRLTFRGPTMISPTRSIISWGAR